MNVTAHEPPIEVPSLDVLPRYSRWPARLLGAEAWSPRTKTRAEVLREFEIEKWGALRARFDAYPQATVDDVEAWDADPSARALVTTSGDAWRFLARGEARQHYMDLVASTLARYFPRGGPSAIVELGCGFGAVALRMAQREVFRGIPFFAGELSPSGQSLTRSLAANSGVEITVGDCDLTNQPLTTLAVPPRAMIYTSYSVHYCPNGNSSLFSALAALQPSVVLHFEPVYEHASETTTLGLMRRRYIEVNGYTRDILTQVRAAGVRVLGEEPAVFGENPLLPVSIVAWEPSVKQPAGENRART
jgi:hypothetical protein